MLAPNPFDLNLRHLRGLVMIAREGSLSAAASAMSLSQPALTQGLVKLETQLGQVLFERRPHGMRATEAGQLLAARADAALAHLRAAGRWFGLADFEPERRLTMTQIKAFLALAREGSHVAAAAMLELSDTSVQRAVRDLEQSLGRELLERRGRSVHLTFAGRRFARSARLAVKDLRAGFSELGVDPAGHRLGIGTTPLARAWLAPEALAIAAAQDGAAGFQVFEGSTAELVEALRDGALDVIVGELAPQDSPDLVKVALREEPLLIVGGRQHPLAGQSHVGMQELGAFPWIIGPESSPLRLEWERLFAGRALPPAPVECGSIMIIGRLLTSSSMLTLATPDQVALQIRSGLLAPIGQPLATGGHVIGATLRAGWRPTASQQRFLDTLQLVAAGQGSGGALAAQWNRGGDD